MSFTFPDNFLWGTSTASAQIESASDHQWKGLKSKDGHVFTRTIDHEKRRSEDLEYICRFGTVYRCSVDWARLQGSPGEHFDSAVVEEYRQFFAELKKRGMQIMFVLNHFTHPIWFEASGGWTKVSNIPHFIDFARKCVHEFGSFVSYWNTFNEPAVYALNGFILGEFPPHKKSFFMANRVLKHMGMAHDETYQLIKSHFPESPVGVSKNTGWFFGTNWPGKIAAGFTDWWFIDYAAKPFRKLDFWGISYYAYIPFTPTPVTEIDFPGKLEKMGIPHDQMWGYYPEGLKKILSRFYKKYRKPIIITENGVCTKEDDFRQKAINDYLKACSEAIESGVDLRGYIFWSTFDNFEWHLGPTYRFGLVEVDMKTMERKMTNAGLLYEKIANNNRIDT